MWSLAIGTFGAGDVYWKLGAVALVALAVSLWAAPVPLRAPARGRHLLIGLGVGIVMTAGTYAAYDLCAKLYPPLAGQVAALYRASHDVGWLEAYGWTAVILTAEEALWRGALLDVATKRFGLRGAVGLSLGTYVLAQAATRSWVVALAALVCGALWTAERLWTRSRLAPLISHAIWTLTVIHAYPVIPLQSVSTSIVSGG